MLFGRMGDERRGRAPRPLAGAGARALRRLYLNRVVPQGAEGPVLAVIRPLPRQRRRPSRWPRLCH